jgi:crotonobetainyl-CoA:carnitine CoA-transferase CaiB-like acyl-CoA transferase
LELSRTALLASLDRKVEEMDDIKSSRSSFGERGMDRKQVYRDITVLSLEQALALPYGTYRLVQEGMRVIRIESPLRGDPNRYVGDEALGESGMNSYFLPVNAGKESITLNLKEEEGKRILYDLIRSLNVDIFASNQIPRNYAKLGIDYETLREVKENIIWVGVTGYGRDIFEPAYDPIIQAECGLMEINGEMGRSPVNIGVPIVDMGAGEHVYGQIMRALFEKELTGEAKRVDVSLFESGLSWLGTHLPVAMSFGIEISRRGNTHQFFAPVCLYETKDGWVYIAIGTDRQWESLVSLGEYQHLDKAEYKTNSGRSADSEHIIREIQKVARGRKSEELLKEMRSAGIVAGRAKTLSEVSQDPMVKKKGLTSKDMRTETEIFLASAPLITPYLESVGRRLPFPPRLGEHNEAIYGGNLGMSENRIAELKERGMI